MIKILAVGLMYLAPSFIFSQNTDIQYILTPSGLFFMIFSWTAIIVWNVICFKKILENKE